MNDELEPNNEENGVAQLALLLHVPIELAKEYYAAVHKYFCNPKPSAFFIVEVIEEDSLVNPKPSLVAKNIAKRLQEYYQKTGHKKSSQMVYVEKKREEESNKSKTTISPMKVIQKKTYSNSLNDHYYESNFQNDKPHRKEKIEEVKAPVKSHKPTEEGRFGKVKNVYKVISTIDGDGLEKITFDNKNYKKSENATNTKRPPFMNDSHLDQSSTCPHGVPLYRICPICNPKEYKFWAGDD